MDRLLHPNRFETEPNAPTAEKLYRHWKITLMNYLEQADANTVTHTPAAIVSAEQAAAVSTTVSCTQEPLQSIDNYMQELQLVAKTCNFEAVTADENK